MKNKLKKMVFLTVIILGIGMSLQGLVYYNDIVCFFNDVPEKQEMARDMVEGSRDFLKAHSESFKMLSMYEMTELQSEFNVADASLIVKNSIQYLDEALLNFDSAINIGRKIGYNGLKLNWFTAFDYDELQVRKGLNTEIYGKVKSFLLKGDVLGLYQQNIDNLKEIYNILVDIRETLNQNKKPSIETCWKLMQKFSETTLWGNYATIIGSTILQNCPR